MCRRQAGDWRRCLCSGSFTPQVTVGEVEKIGGKSQYSVQWLSAEAELQPVRTNRERQSAVRSHGHAKRAYSVHSYRTATTFHDCPPFFVFTHPFLQYRRPSRRPQRHSLRPRPIGRLQLGAVSSRCWGTTLFVTLAQARTIFALRSSFDTG